ncbi:unnamed protein product [Menidia menidia]|uniref:(Atlantic silverside) hypothetical protein n=1 Tax=Menidia menidia TaxID=238744 RepID=A0A8S4BLA8_9TELE|nr:unnamed protein product [Menidia menidia]
MDVLLWEQDQDHKEHPAILPFLASGSKMQRMRQQKLSCILASVKRGSPSLPVLYQQTRQALLFVGVTVESEAGEHLPKHSPIIDPHYPLRWLNRSIHFCSLQTIILLKTERMRTAGIKKIYLILLVIFSYSEWSAKYYEMFDNLAFLSKRREFKASPIWHFTNVNHSFFVNTSCCSITTYSCTIV